MCRFVDQIVDQIARGSMIKIGDICAEDRADNGYLSVTDIVIAKSRPEYGAGIFEQLTHDDSDKGDDAYGPQRNVETKISKSLIEHFPENGGILQIGRVASADKQLEDGQHNGHAYPFEYHLRDIQKNQQGRLGIAELDQLRKVEKLFLIYEDVISLILK